METLLVFLALQRITLSSPALHSEYFTYCSVLCWFWSIFSLQDAPIQQRPKMSCVSPKCVVLSHLTTTAPFLLFVIWNVWSNYASTVAKGSLFTDLLFSQMIIQRAKENKNRGRLMTANASGLVGCSLSRSALALALACLLRSYTRSADLRRKNKTSVGRLDQRWQNILLIPTWNIILLFLSTLTWKDRFLLALYFWIEQEI